MTCLGPATPSQHTLDSRTGTGDDTHLDPGLVLINPPSRKPSKITLLAFSLHIMWLSQPVATSTTQYFVHIVRFNPSLYGLFLTSCAKTKQKRSASSADCREVRREQLQSPCYCQDRSGVLLISFKGGGGRWVRGTVIVSTELIWRMKGQNGETAGESDRYHGFIVMRYISMLEKQKG